MRIKIEYMKVANIVFIEKNILDFSEFTNDENRKSILLNYGKTFIKPSLYKTSIIAKKD